MTDETPAHGCTIDGQPAMPIRVDEYNQLVAENNRLASELGDYDQRVEQLTSELAALRAVARGYCPACGRGDAAPTVADWEQQKQRANEAEQRLHRIADGHRRADAIQAEIGEMIAQTHELREQLRLADAMRQQNLDAAAAALQRAEQAEAERDEARQHAAAIAAQRDRLRQRMHALADRWDTALAVDKPYARTLRNEISVAPFDPEGAMTVREYTERGRRLWAFRCWGTDTCEGWLGLGHHTQSSALIERERHVAEAHAAPAPAATEAPVLYQHFKGGVYEVTGTATHTSSGEQLVVYRAADGQTWARPMDEFTGTVDGQPRFTRIETTAATDEPA